MCVRLQYLQTRFLGKQAVPFHMVIDLFLCKIFYLFLSVFYLSLLKHQTCRPRISTHAYKNFRLIPRRLSAFLKFSTCWKSDTCFLCWILYLWLYASIHQWRQFIQLSYKFDAVISFEGFPMQTRFILILFPCYFFWKFICSTSHWRLLWYLWFI